ncbi:MAG TPA: dihydropteroate synthase, partial [Thermoanaerobaculia bacterium]|nr:dihydropteroate synthase [Thermoanaerobaculia bacterium]
MTVATPRPTTRSWTLRLPGGRDLTLGERPRVMGVLNLTPDSFSDGGRWLDPERALAHALEMIADGADVLDLGAESTRPGGGIYGTGAPPVSADEEWRRLSPVLTALRRRTDLPLAVDTRRGEVARRALAEGADLINDVSALGDPATTEAVAEAGCPVVLMHSRGETATMQRQAQYGDVVAEVHDELGDALERATAGGIAREQTVLDPGIGFAKDGGHNLAVLAHLDRLADLGRPLLVGASRKAFIGQLAGGAEPSRRLAGSLAVAIWAVERGAAM